MARLVYPTPEQWVVLKELGLLDGKNAVLVAPSIADSVKALGPAAETAAEKYEDYIKRFYGTDFDLQVELVESDEHPFFDAVSDSGSTQPNSALSFVMNHALYRGLGPAIADEGDRCHEGDRASS